jgi:hypothetical protein
VREKRPSPGGVEELDDDELVLREVACVQRQHRLLCGASTLVHRKNSTVHQKKSVLFIKKINRCGAPTHTAVLASALEPAMGGKDFLTHYLRLTWKSMAPTFSFFLAFCKAITTVQRMID